MRVALEEIEMTSVKTGLGSFFCFSRGCSSTALPRPYPQIQVAETI